jgi:hypothetical protein
MSGLRAALIGSGTAEHRCDNRVRIHPARFIACEDVTVSRRGRPGTPAGSYPFACGKTG